MELRGDGILLRAWRLTDVSAVAAACRDPEIPRWIPWVPKPYTNADAEDYVRGCLEAPEERRAFAIVDEEGGRLFGSIELRISARLASGHIGYWVVAGARGRGVATSALRALSRWALDELRLGRLELVTDPENVASQRVAEKAGFRREGILRSHTPHRDGRRRDSVLFSLLPSRSLMAQFHFTPERYLELMHEELPRYDELQTRVGAACSGGRVTRILELGTGTGETTRRVLAVHPQARLVGVDESPPMLEQARLILPADQVEELSVGRLQEPLPAGPFDLVVSALAVHHLDGAGKRDLFLRVRDVLPPGGRFVLADVVVPETPEDAVTPLEEGFDLPDTLADQVAWLEDAGLAVRVTWTWRDVAVVAATRP